MRVQEMNQFPQLRRKDLRKYLRQKKDKKEENPLPAKQGSANKDFNFKD
jgi:hypothetical protein